jgi:hypothetical protein
MRFIKEKCETAEFQLELAQYILVVVTRPRNHLKEPNYDAAQVPVQASVGRETVLQKGLASDARLPLSRYSTRPKKRPDSAALLHQII